NCDGSDLACAAGDIDADGDGFTINEGDCDDSNAARYPGATEICEDGIDNNCFEGDGPAGDRLCSSEVSCVDIADLPLDTQFRSAPAMLMFVLDDSGSMDWEFSIQGQTDGLFDDYVEYLFDNPGDNGYGNILTDDQRRQWKSQWSSYNKMYFNPTVTYAPWPRWNELSGTQGYPLASANADPDTPRSNPRYSGNTFNLDGEFLRIGGTAAGGGMEQVSVLHQDEWYQYYGHWYERVTGADAVRLYQGGTEYMTVDNEDGSYFSTTGTWSTTTNGSEVNSNSRYSTSNNATANWQLPIPLADAGTYEVRVWVPNAGYRNVQTAPYTITHAGGTTTVTMDQSSNRETWYSLGTYTFNGADIAADISIKRSHYYVWNDVDNDGTIDTNTGEVYLVNLDGTAASGDFAFYQFLDADNDNVIDDGELASRTHNEARTAGVYPTDDEGTELTYAQVRQNFANWYSFYRRRELTAKAAVGKVIFDMQGVKIGFKAINGSVNETVKAIKIPGETDYTDYMLNQLYGINSSGSTSLRAALLNVGRYFHATDGQTGGLGSSPYAAEADGGGVECPPFTVGL
ncbi:MAG: hypothetical protein JJ992_06310, partial [Planctomycetes bacterium]|nr:hypothetical protein [Planctomycetota bacterium]